MESTQYYYLTLLILIFILLVEPRKRFMLWFAKLRHQPLQKEKATHSIDDFGQSDRHGACFMHTGGTNSFFCDSLSGKTFSNPIR